MGRDLMEDPKIVGNNKVPTIPFNLNGQRAIFGKLFTLPGLGQRAISKLIPQNFIEEDLQILFRLLQEMQIKNQCFPSVESFTSYITFNFKGKFDLIKINKLETLVNECIRQSYNYDERIVTKTLTDWLQTLSYRDTLVKCALIGSQIETLKL